MSEIDFVRQVEKSLGSLVPEKLYALALRGAAIPDEATAEMIDAGYGNKDVGSPAIVYRGVWRDMLRTALSPTTQEGE